MKKFLAWLLLAATMLSLCGCTAAPGQSEPTAVPVQTAIPEVTEVQTEPAQTVPEAEESPLFLTVSSITFSVVGETENIYLGLAPREQVSWESDDPAIVSVEGGVLTANGVGTTVVRASCGSQTVEVTAGCLAQTREELEALDPEVLSAPKRLLPEVDLEESCTYFDNAAIIGDSITYFLFQSESQNNYLGDMTFVTRQGISINSLVRRFKNIYFKGREMNIEDIVAQCEAERVYIMLGCLDFQVQAARTYVMDNWNIMLDRILEKSPDREIVIISNIPSFTEETALTEFNAAVAETNVQLRQLAADKGCGFLDLGCYIQDHCGRMPAVYCKDEFHMNAEGSLAWMKILRYYARFEQEGGSLA